MNLYLFRHGIAVDRDQPGYEDDSQTPQDFIDDLRRQKIQCHPEPLFACANF